MLVAAGLQRVADEYQKEGKAKLFEELKIFLTAQCGSPADV